MVNIISREEFVQFLKAQGFKEPHRYDNRREFLKVFAPGIIIEVMFFKTYHRIYELHAYLLLDQLFPNAKAIPKDDRRNVGVQYAEANCIICKDGKVDLDKFKRLYNEKRADLEQVLSVVRRIPKTLK